MHSSERGENGGGCRHSRTCTHTRMHTRTYMHANAICVRTRAHTHPRPNADADADERATRKRELRERESHARERERGARATHVGEMRERGNNGPSGAGEVVRPSPPSPSKLAVPTPSPPCTHGAFAAFALMNGKCRPTASQQTRIERFRRSTRVYNEACGGDFGNLLDRAARAAMF